MIETIRITCNKDFLEFLHLIEDTTKKFFDSNSRSMTTMPSFHVELHTDLDFSEKMCKRISSGFKYFRGLFDGRGHKISATSEKATSLFSSLYFSKVRNLTLHNVRGSRGFIMADDILSSELENIDVTGAIYVSESLGALFRTAQDVKFTKCSVNIITRAVTIAKPAEGSDAEKEDNLPPHFGGFVGVDLGNLVFDDCSVSGDLLSEVAVGGFCAVSRNTLFNQCNVDELTVSGTREVGLFVGRGSKEIDFKGCVINNSKVYSKHWAGYLVGKSDGSINVDNVVIDDCLINPKGTLTFVGGIAGSAKSITVTNSNISGAITGNIIIAGVCPDVETAEVHNNKFDLSITAVGYSPMMTHAYPLVRQDFLTSEGAEITFKESNNKSRIKVMELELEGMINPFEESLL